MKIYRYIFAPTLVEKLELYRHELNGKRAKQAAAAAVAVTSLADDDTPKKMLKNQEEIPFVNQGGYSSHGSAGGGSVGGGGGSGGGIVSADTKRPASKQRHDTEHVQLKTINLNKSQEEDAKLKQYQDKGFLELVQF